MKSDKMIMMIKKIAQSWKNFLALNDKTAN